MVGLEATVELRAATRRGPSRRDGAAVVILLALVARAPLPAQQPALRNPGFEEGTAEDGRPLGWGASRTPGYRVRVSEGAAFDGLHSLVLEGLAGADRGSFGSFNQSLDVSPWRGRTLRVRAMARLVAGDSASAGGLWVRVDRPDGAVGFFDNMLDRPIRGPEWREVVTLADVDDDAERLVVGGLLVGRGALWMDAVRLEVVDPASEPPPAAAARAYLDSALALMARHSVRRAQVDWAALRAGARRRLHGARDEAGTWPAIRWALRELGDRHSFFLSPAEARRSAAAGSAWAADSSAGLLEGRVGYVRIPAYAGEDSALAARFAQAVQDAIAGQAAAGACGWVVDLRGNGGGNMWPMLAGLGPLLGGERLGAFVTPDGRRSAWHYAGGTSWLDSLPMAGPVAAPRVLRSLPPVAVLTDQGTGSSGEAVAIAFRERPGARSFGAATAGLSTANEPFALPDGARLFLTVSVMADRTGTLYGARVPPDEVVAAGEGGTDPVLDAARRWLAGQPACLPPPDGR